jgi:hypothetical protein
MTESDTKNRPVANQTMGWYSCALLMLHCTVIAQQLDTVGQSLHIGDLGAMSVLHPKRANCCNMLIDAMVT